MAIVFNATKSAQGTLRLNRNVRSPLAPIRTMGERGLVPVDVENLRLHYARTLNEWSKRFEAKAQGIREVFDDGFVRMWRLYLNGSAAAFRWGDIRLYQILFTNGLDNSLAMTRDHLYRT